MTVRRFRDGAAQHAGSGLRTDLESLDIECMVDDLAAVIERALIAREHKPSEARVLAARESRAIVDSLLTVLHRQASKPARAFSRRDERAAFRRYVSGLPRGTSSRKFVLSSLQNSKLRKGDEPDYAVRELALWLRYLLARAGVPIGLGTRSYAAQAFDAVLFHVFENPRSGASLLRSIKGDEIFPFAVRLIGEG